MEFSKPVDDGMRREQLNATLQSTFDVLTLMSDYRKIANPEGERVAQLIPPQIGDFLQRLILDPVSEINRTFTSLKSDHNHPHTLVDSAGKVFASSSVRLTIDNDGTAGNASNDPSHDTNTSWRFHGRSLDPTRTSYVAVPADLAKYPANKSGTIELGTLVIIERDGKFAACVAGDVGNRTTTTEGKGIGEISVHAAELIGVDSSPVNGGTDDHHARIIFTNQLVSGISDFDLNLQARAWLASK